MNVKFNGKVRSDAITIESVVLNCSTTEALIIYDALRLLASSEDKTAVDRRLAERLADKMGERSEANG